MAFLQVYFNNELKFTVPLQLAATSIGRASDNHVVIHNSGVSGHHAVIVREGETYYVADNNSTNGVFLNGRRIFREPLRYGDEITIFKHKLKFTAVDLSPAEDTVTETQSQIQASSAINHDQTIMVNDAQLRAILQQQRANAAYLVQNGGSQDGLHLSLKNQSFDIGKSKTCDLCVGGWFAPKISAVITRQSDGYYLAPEKWSKVIVNGKRIRVRIKLQHLDDITVHNTSVTFNHAATKTV